MEEREWIKKFEQKEISFINFIEFLHICVGDKKFEHSFEFVYSTKTKVNIVGICLNEFFAQLIPYQEELEVLRKEGYVEGIQYLTLIVKYETFLNSIYSLMENVAFIVSSVYPKESLPRTFHDQKNRILKNPTIDKEYSKILEHLNWYDEVRSMRSEFTHFLTGMVVSFNGDIPGYINNPKSQRKDTMSKIEIRDIREHGQEVYNKLIQFLEDFGKHFKTLINKDIRVVEICGITNDYLIGTKMISYYEKINSKPGICNSYKLDCPNADSCEARKNTDLETGKEKDAI